MGKKYGSFIIMLILFIGIGLADTGSQTLQKQFDAMKKMNYLNQVGVYFINETTKATPKEYNLNINQGESKKITLLLKNDSTKDLHFRVKFADQVISNGGDRGCATNYNQGFSNFIKAPRTGDIIVPAQSKITKKVTVQFPIGIQGIQKGCIAYGITEDSENNTTSLISIITRKVLYFQTLVGGTGVVAYSIDLGNITKSINTKGELEITMPIKNKGNVDSSIVVTGDISNILGFDRPIAISGEILQGEEGTLTANVGPLPFYKGIFTINAMIKYKPVFGFDANKFGIDPKIIAGGEKTINNLYFVPHWRMLITLLLLITIFYTTLRKRKPKAVVENKPPAV